MSTCAFAHAVYGVLLDAEDDAALSEYVFDDEGEEDYDEAALRKSADHLLQGLQKKYNAPPDARLFHTASEDDHPYRSATPPDSWVLGYPLSDFPRDVTEAWLAVADWHTWVTAG